MNRQFEESGWRWMAVDYPRPGWLALFGGGLNSALDGNKLKKTIPYIARRFILVTRFLATVSIVISYKTLPRISPALIKNYVLHLQTLYRESL